MAMTNNARRAVSTRLQGVQSLPQSRTTSPHASPRRSRVIAGEAGSTDLVVADDNENHGEMDVMMSDVDIKTNTGRNPADAAGVYATWDASVHHVGSSRDVDACQAKFASYIEAMTMARSASATEHNDASSRSHALFTIHVRVHRRRHRRQDRDRDRDQDPDHHKTENRNDELDDGQLTVASLTLVDLAGSERAGALELQERRREGAQTNLQLLALTQCLVAVAEGRRHVPWRDAVLTRLLRNALSHNASTVFLACISPLGAHALDAAEALDRVAVAIRLKTRPGTNHVSSRRQLGPQHHALARHQTYAEVVGKHAAEVHGLRKRVRDLERDLTLAQTQKGVKDQGYQGRDQEEHPHPHSHPHLHMDMDTDSLRHELAEVKADLEGEREARQRERQETETLRVLARALEAKVGTAKTRWQEQRRESEILHARALAELKGRLADELKACEVKYASSHEAFQKESHRARQTLIDERDAWRSQAVERDAQLEQLRADQARHDEETGTRWHETMARIETEAREAQEGAARELHALETSYEALVLEQRTKLAALEADVETWRGRAEKAEGAMVDAEREQQRIREMLTERVKLAEEKERQHVGEQLQQETKRAQMERSWQNRIADAEGLVEVYQEQIKAYEKREVEHREASQQAALAANTWEEDRQRLEQQVTQAVKDVAVFKEDLVREEARRCEVEHQWREAEGTWRAAKAQYDEEASQRRSELDLARQEAATAKAAAGRGGTEREELVRKVTQAETLVGRLEHTGRALQKERDDLRVVVRDRELRVTALEQELARAKSAGSEQAATATLALAQLKLELATAHSSLAERQQEEIDLRRQITDLRAELQSARHNATQAAQQVTRVTARLEEEREVAAAAASVHGELTVTHSAAVAAHTEAERAWESDLAAKQQRVVDLEHEVERGELARRKLADQFETTMAGLLKRKDAETAIWETQRVAHTQEAKRRETEWQVEKAELRKRIQALSEDLTKVKQQHAAEKVTLRSEWESQVTRLEGENRGLTRTIEMLEASEWKTMGRVESGGGGKVGAAMETNQEKRGGRRSALRGVWSTFAEPPSPSPSESAQSARSHDDEGVSEGEIPASMTMLTPTSTTGPTRKEEGVKLGKEGAMATSTSTPVNWRNGLVATGLVAEGAGFQADDDGLQSPLGQQQRQRQERPGRPGRPGQEEERVPVKLSSGSRPERLSTPREMVVEVQEDSNADGEVRTEMDELSNRRTSLELDRDQDRRRHGQHGIKTTMTLLGQLTPTPTTRMGTRRGRRGTKTGAVMETNQPAAAAAKGDAHPGAPSGRPSAAARTPEPSALGALLTHLTPRAAVRSVARLFGRRVSEDGSKAEEQDERGRGRGDEVGGLEIPGTPMMFVETRRGRVTGAGAKRQREWAPTPSPVVMAREGNEEDKGVEVEVEEQVEEKKKAGRKEKEKEKEKVQVKTVESPGQEQEAEKENENDKEGFAHDASTGTGGAPHRRKRRLGKKVAVPEEREEGQAHAGTTLRGRATTAPQDLGDVQSLRRLLRP